MRIEPASADPVNLGAVDLAQTCAQSLTYVVAMIGKHHRKLDDHMNLRSAAGQSA
jgi:hypothetical protein